MTPTRVRSIVTTCVVEFGSSNTHPGDNIWVIPITARLSARRLYMFHFITRGGSFSGGDTNTPYVGEPFSDKGGQGHPYVSGLGLDWKAIEAIQSTYTTVFGITVFNYGTRIAVGVPQAGVIILDFNGNNSRGNPPFQTDLAWYLTEHDNVPLTNFGYDAIVQTRHSNLSSNIVGDGPGVRLISPIASPLNQVVVFVSADNQAFDPLWNYDVLQRGAMNSFIATNVTYPASQDFKVAAIGGLDKEGVNLIELGYRNQTKPWLRQRQRDDF